LKSLFNHSSFPICPYVACVLLVFAFAFACVCLCFCLCLLACGLIIACVLPLFSLGLLLVSFVAAVAGVVAFVIVAVVVVRLSL
jgi:hypothetical protein